MDNKFTRKIENKKTPENFLNDWDKKYLEKGTLEIIKKLYSDFDHNFPEIILLPERGARPLFFLLNPIFKKFEQKKGTRMPKFIYFSVSKKAGVNLSIFEKYNDIETTSDLGNIMLENDPDLPIDIIQELIDEERVEDVMIARETMEKRAEEIKEKISKENIVIFDEVLSNGGTIGEIRRAFNDNAIPAYTIVALNDGYAPSTESGYRFNEELDEKNPQVGSYSFSLEQAEDAIGVNKSITNKYSTGIQKNNAEEKKELEEKKKRLRGELKNLGIEISKRISI